MAKSATFTSIQPHKKDSDPFLGYMVVYKWPSSVEKISRDQRLGNDQRFIGLRPDNFLSNMASAAWIEDHKGGAPDKVEMLQQQMETLQRHMAEQAMLRQKLEELTSGKSASKDKTDEKVSTNNVKIKRRIGRNNESDTKNFKQTSNKAVEEIIAKRTKEFKQSQAEKAATLQYLAQQRQQIMDARNRLREQHDMFRSLPSPVGAEIVMKYPSGRSQNLRSTHSPELNIHKLVTEIPYAINRIQNLREGLHQDFLVRRKPYAGELGISSYEPWQIPDFLLVRHLVEDFVDDFIFKHIPSSDTVIERNQKIKRLNKKDKHWFETSEALTDRSAVKLVAEEILLEVTAKLTRDVASEGIHLDVMFKRMSDNMFMKEAEVQATGNPNGRDPSDPAYDLITRYFSSLQRNRDQNKKGVWVHSQTMTHPAIPPPLPLVPQSVPKTQKQSRQKTMQKQDANTEQKPGSTRESLPKGQKTQKNMDF